jgi:UPF0716 protein FxsA
MPFALLGTLGILIALPVLDIYATVRLAEALNVPGIALFIPGVIFGAVVMKRETRTLRAQFVGAMQSMALQGMVFDSGRRMLAAVLLLLPGMVSDLFAVFLLLVPNRAMPQAAAAAAQTGAKTLDGEFRRVE